MKCFNTLTFPSCAEAPRHSQSQKCAQPFRLSHIHRISGERYHTLVPPICDQDDSAGRTHRWSAQAECNDGGANARRRFLGGFPPFSSHLKVCCRRGVSVLVQKHAPTACTCALHYVWSQLDRFGRHANSIADLDGSYGVVSHSRRHLAVPKTVTLSRIAYRPSPPARTEAQKRGTPCL